MRANDLKSILILSIVLYLSGASLYLLDHFIRVQTEIGEQHHPIESWVRLAHGTITYVAVLAMGYLLKSHVLPGLRSPTKRGKKSGVTLLVWFGVMVFSALGVLYAQEGSWRSFITQAHGIVGLSIPIWALIHLRFKSKGVRSRSA